MLKEYPLSINAPIDKVFSCISDKEKIKQWMEGESKIDFKSAHDFADPVGTKFQQNFANLLKMDGEVLSYKPPIEFGLGMVVVGLRGTAFYHLSEESPNCTKVKLAVEFFDQNNKAKFILRTLGPLFEKVIHRHLAGIKKLAEE